MDVSQKRMCNVHGQQEGHLTHSVPVNRYVHIHDQFFFRSSEDEVGCRKSPIARCHCMHQTRIGKHFVCETLSGLRQSDVQVHNGGKPPIKCGVPVA